LRQYRSTCSSRHARTILPFFVVLMFRRLHSLPPNECVSHNKHRWGRGLWTVGEGQRLQSTPTARIPFHDIRNRSGAHRAAPSRMAKRDPFFDGTGVMSSPLMLVLSTRHHHLNPLGQMERAGDVRSSGCRTADGSR
jgi:hypothetical protein